MTRSRLIFLALLLISGRAISAEIDIDKAREMLKKLWASQLHLQPIQG